MLITKVCSFVNGLGKTCEEGKNCPADQVCESLKCISCEDGKEPDELQLKCTASMFYHFFSNNHQR